MVSEVESVLLRAFGPKEMREGAHPPDTVKGELQ